MMADTHGNFSLSAMAFSTAVAGMLWLASPSGAADHTMALTPVQELVLADCLAAMNAQRATQKDADGKALAPWTADAMLQHVVVQHLKHHQRDLEAETASRLEVLKDLATTPEAQKAVLSKTPASKRAWLQYQLGK